VVNYVVYKCPKNSVLFSLYFGRASVCVLFSVCTIQCTFKIKVCYIYFEVTTYFGDETGLTYDGSVAGED